MGLFIKKRKWLILLCTIMLLFHTKSFHVQAKEKVLDIGGNWAEEVLGRWLDRGLVQGYKDGTIRPNAPITRAEFVSIIQRIYGYEGDCQKAPFIDISSGSHLIRRITKWNLFWEKLEQFVLTLSLWDGCNVMEGYYL